MKINKKYWKYKKSFLISLIIFIFCLGIFIFYPNKKIIIRETWSLQKVLDYSKSGQVVHATLKFDPNRGKEWYLIRGEAKKFNKNHNILFQSQGRLTENKFNDLIYSKSGDKISQIPSSTFITDVITSILTFLIIIGILYFFAIRQLKLANKGAMLFGKSKAKSINQDSRLASFKDVAGCEEALEEVKEIVDFLKDPKKFQYIGGRIPKGILLIGAPGTGKTLLARAIAGEAKVPFFSISGSDFVEMFVGVGSSRVRDMFEQGKKHSPCIIFIDEIDAIGRQRGGHNIGGGNDEREQTLNSLLVEMDGFDVNKSIIIIAATNRPDVLDNALLRPGRFDRQVIIDLPDVQGRKKILIVHSKKIKLSTNIDLNIIARNTPGFSGADLANLMNESALIAAKYNKKSVELSDIEEAREKIAFGRERRRLMDKEDKKITAVHEAGHAIVQAVIDDGYLPIHKVTIIPRGQSLGSTMFSPKKDILTENKEKLLNQICCAMGGRIAEKIILNIETSGAYGDILMATKIARNMVCNWGMSKMGLIAFNEKKDNVFLNHEYKVLKNYSEYTAKKIDEEIYDIINYQYNRAEEIIKKYKPIVECIINDLMKYETISGGHVYNLVKKFNNNNN